MRIHMCVSSKCFDDGLLVLFFVLFVVAAALATATFTAVHLLLKTLAV